MSRRGASREARLTGGELEMGVRGAPMIEVAREEDAGGLLWYKLVWYKLVWYKLV